MLGAIQKSLLGDIRGGEGVNNFDICQGQADFTNLPRLAKFQVAYRSHEILYNFQKPKMVYIRSENKAREFQKYICVCKGGGRST